MENGEEGAKTAEEDGDQELAPKEENEKSPPMIRNKLTQCVIVYKYI